MIRQTRRRLEMSQEFVAAKLGITQKAYSDIENGRTKIKSETLIKLAEIFNVSPSEICPIAESCNCNLEHSVVDKYKQLLQFLKDNNISVPDDLV